MGSELEFLIRILFRHEEVFGWTILSAAARTVGRVKKSARMVLVATLRWWRGPSTGCV